ncbi:protein BONZAI 3-like [Silene latifolia]|uniref:protein BONZAI 3-like n=1 Tax=Silene latifolia TaxID=37657 RepID=UPI003D77B039
MVGEIGNDQIGTKDLFFGCTGIYQAVGTGNMPANHGNGQVFNGAIDHFYKAHGLQPMFFHLELTLSATKLRDCDIFSKSDPMAVVYMKNRDGTLLELGRTEVILNSLSPSWIQKIPIAYNFEIVQHLEFRIYDVDTKFYNIPVKNLNLSEQDYLGEASCFLSEIVTKPSQELTINIQNKSRQGNPGRLGTLTVHTEETAESKTTVEIVFRCTNLTNKDVFSLSDPFLKISRNAESGATIPVCKTEVIDNNLNPTWQPVCLTMQQIVSKDNPLIMECFDYDSNGNHELIGKVQRSMLDLKKLHREKSGTNFVVTHRGRDKVLKGELFVDMYREKQTYSFLDYLSSGFELSFMVAVDFTLSNGNPKLPQSLHYIDPSGHLNAYQRAIVEVGDVLQFYDSDKRFPAWGFGGRTPDGNVSYCFNLNLSPHDSEVDGVQGIKVAYAHAFQNVGLAGPTLVGKVIDKASKIAAESVSRNNYKYYVLLLITDGVLSDLEEAINALVKASDLPLSVLIVGVGNADFTHMEILDGDYGGPLKSSGGKLAARDIVQFMPMREVDAGQISSIETLLAELPGQFLAYMNSKNLQPLH